MKKTPLAQNRNTIVAYIGSGAVTLLLKLTYDERNEQKSTRFSIMKEKVGELRIGRRVRCNDRHARRIAQPTYGIHRINVRNNIVVRFGWRSKAKRQRQTTKSQTLLLQWRQSTASKRYQTKDHDSCLTHSSDKRQRFNSYLGRWRELVNDVLNTTCSNQRIKQTAIPRQRE